MSQKIAQVIVDVPTMQTDKPFSYLSQKIFITNKNLIKIFLTNGGF